MSGLAAPAGISNAVLRRNNLSTLATLVHRDGQLSRAELTQQTGLNRSAISGLIGELVELGWVHESLPPPSGRIGRPSPIVTPGSAFAAVGVHVDVDAITIGLVDLSGELLRRVRVDTHSAPTPADLVRTVTVIVNGFTFEPDEKRTIIGVGVAIPGLVDAATKQIRWTPHLGWKAVDIASPLEAGLGIPVFIGNDASLEAIAEARFGAARGIEDLVYVAGHAGGIGGGVIADGIPLQGASGYAAELGHTLVKTDGTACSCGRRGCLEAEVHLRGLLTALQRNRIDQDELDIALSTNRGPAVRAEVRRQLGHLAQGLSTFVHLFNPRIVVLGGFLGSLLSADREHLTAELDSRLMVEFRRTVKIERAALRARLEVVGAAELPISFALGDPAQAVVNGQVQTKREHVTQ